MEHNKLIEEVLNSEPFKMLLREYLAKKISDEYHFKDIEGFLIKKEVREIVKKEAETMVKELVDSYFEMHSIKRLIEGEIRNMTKTQIIQLIMSK